MPYEIYMEENENIPPMANYISIQYTNRLLDRVKKPKYSKRHNISINVDKDININHRYFNYTDINNYLPTKEIYLKSDNNDNFKLNDFLLPYKSKKGEDLYLTKEGKLLIDKKQKDILEDYVNNYIDEKEENKSKGKKIKKRCRTKTPSKINELHQKEELKMSMPYFYINQRKASFFDKSIFKICHKVIDNYKKLENKENLFSFKTRSKSRPMLREKNDYDNKEDKNFEFKKYSSKKSFHRIKV